MIIEGQGYFFTIYFPGFVLCLTRPRYQVSVYRTIGLLVISLRTLSEYKNLTLVSGTDRQICHKGHCLASRGSVYQYHMLMIDSFSFTPLGTGT